MKTASIVLLLCMASSAVCQTVEPAPSNPLQLFQTPSAPAKPWMDFSNLPPLQPYKLSALLQRFIIPKSGITRSSNEAQIDPKIIVHPPQSRLGIQQRGINIATNQFPNLRFLPISSPGSASHSIPTQWPGFGLEEIPTTWPKFALSPVNGSKQATPQPTVQFPVAVEPQPMR